MPGVATRSRRPPAGWSMARAASASSRRCCRAPDRRSPMPHRIVVTGGSGVIGRELLGRLVAGGAEVMSLDREPLPDRLARRVHQVQVDLSEGGMDEIREFRPDTIYHLAAALERSEEESGFWLPGYRDNIAVSHRLHDAIRKVPGLRTYVFASSYLIYEPSLYLLDAPRTTPVALRDAPDRAAQPLRRRQVLCRDRDAVPDRGRPTAAPHDRRADIPGLWLRLARRGVALGARLDLGAADRRL